MVNMRDVADGSDIADLKDHLFGEIKKRAGNPFLASFFIGMASANYKAFVILFSDESFRAKFAYLENVLYPNKIVWGMHFIVMPLIVAIIFGLGWPWLDGWVSSLLVVLDNKKKDKIMIKQRMRSISEEEKIQLYEKHDKEVAELRSRISMAQEDRKKIFKENSFALQQMKERLERQVFQRMADFAGVGGQEIRSVFSAQLWMLTEKERTMQKVLKKVPQMKQLAKVLPAMKELPTSSDLRRMGNVDWLARTLDESKDNAMAFYEILYTFNLVGAWLDEGMNFDVYVEGPTDMTHWEGLVKVALE